MKRFPWINNFSSDAHKALYLNSELNPYSPSVSIYGLVDNGTLIIRDYFIGRIESAIYDNFQWVTAEWGTYYSERAFFAGSDGLTKKIISYDNLS